MTAVLTFAAWVSLPVTVALVVDALAWKPQQRIRAKTDKEQQ